MVDAWAPTQATTARASAAVRMDWVKDLMASMARWCGLLTTRTGRQSIHDEDSVLGTAQG